MQKDVLVIHTDGGSRGNPGLAACSFVAEIDGKILKKQSKFLDKATNNVAEYQGVVLALNWLLDNITSYSQNTIIFFLDSELVVRQLNGLYKIKNSELLSLSLLIRKLIKDLNRNILFKNIPRSENKVADFLVNQELDNH